MAGAGAGAWPLLLLLLGATAPASTDAACPDACACFRDARLWLALPREDTLTARCTRRGLSALPAGLDADVRHLDVSGNWLSQLRDGHFLLLGLRRLLSVDVSANALDEVQAGAFRGLRELRRVSLAHNRIQTLPADLFAATPDLWWLSLAGNPLVVPAAAPLLSAPSLRLLDVSDCKLREFPDRLLGEDNSLQELIAARNGIEEVHVAWSRHLRRLDVSDNHLRRMPNTALHEASQLRSLVLDGNALRLSNRSSLVSSPSLRSLSAARCGLSVLHGSSFTEVPLLEELSLETNGLTALPRDVFSSLPALQRVDLRANRLQRLPIGVFAQNTVLRALDLSHNHLDAELLLADPEASEEEPAPWLEVKSLRELSLSHCGLRSLPADLFVGVPSLRNLTVSGNLLRTVEVQLLDSLTKLRALDLRENPLHCDAKLHGLWLAVQARHVRTVATCSEPPGDWEMLRFFTPLKNAQNTTDLPKRDAQNVNGEEQENRGMMDVLIDGCIRWVPPVGVFVLAIVSVLVLRKWMNRLTVKSQYYKSRSKEYVYESEEDEGATMTVTTSDGSPRVTPTSAIPLSPSSPRPTAAATAVAAPGSRFAVSSVHEAPVLLLNGGGSTSARLSRVQ